ncbi:MAG: hypothetical protein M1296_06110 [Chloroflexi bacterium]|nr:hypothetical protein [Chloroflexota bacterium]
MWGVLQPDERDARRRERAARQLTRWLNAHDLPGVDPFTWRERLLFWLFVLAVIVIVVFGSTLLQPR